jgi:hypothetical protein
MLLPYLGHCRALHGHNARAWDAMAGLDFFSSFSAWIFYPEV